MYLSIPEQNTVLNLYHFCMSRFRSISFEMLSDKEGNSIKLFCSFQILVSNQTFVYEHVTVVYKNAFQDKQVSDLHEELGKHVR